jgi:hypothetical protein
MGNSGESTTPKSIWVGLWHGKRHVVFDPSIQPENPEFILLYFVEGHALCTRKRTVERKAVTTVHDSEDREFALAQYGQWVAANARIADNKKTRPELEVEDPPPPRKKCPECDGQPTWFDTVNKPTYGVISEGPNIIERCPHCNGKGFVSDVL